MKDGYYLFCYLVVDELASDYRVYLRHDQNFSLWKKTEDEVELVHYWEVERITRNKQHYMPIRTREQAIHLINYCLKEYGLTFDDMEEVLGTPKLTEVDHYEKLCVHKEYAMHTISHLYSTIMTDTSLFYHDNIIGFAVDAGPDSIIEWNHVKNEHLIEYAGCVVTHGKMEIFEVKTPGLLWLAAVNKYNYREGTLMALASASESKLLENTVELPQLNDPNNLDEVIEYVEKLDEVISNLTEEDENKKLNYFDQRYSRKDNIISMVMKVIQQLSIEIMDQNVKEIVDKYHINPSEYNLAIGGGYALNCPTNSYLLDKYKFKTFMAPPCVNDSGQTLGMALCYFRSVMEKFKFKLGSAYYGDAIKGNEFCEDDYKGFIKSVQEYNRKQAVEDIIAGPIVWCMGQSEIGPRALGHRSIIADPRRIESKDRINEIKKRQWWRPVAPIIREEEISHWFYGEHPSPYMLCTYKIREEKADKVPAILHLDQSARIQSVGPNDDQKLYQLLDEFQKCTGVPIVCNTSLNDAGEPIINTMAEAINFALRKRIPIVYFDDYRVELENFDDYKEQQPLKANEEIESIFEPGTEEERMLTNPNQLEYGYIKYYYNRLNISHLDIKNKKDIKMLKKVFQYEANLSPSLYELFDLKK